MLLVPGMIVPLQWLLGYLDRVRSPTGLESSSILIVHWEGLTVQFQLETGRGVTTLRGRDGLQKNLYKVLERGLNRRSATIQTFL